MSSPSRPIPRCFSIPIWIFVGILAGPLHLSGSASRADEPWLGMNSGHGGDLEAVVADLREAAIRIVRTGGNAADPEKHAAVVAQLTEARLEVHWVINYRGNGVDPRGTSIKELAKLEIDGPVMKQWQANYRARCVAIMRRYSSPGNVLIRHYICGNEPDKRDNHTGLPGRPDIAVKLTQAMHEAAREVNAQDIRVESPPVSAPDADYLRKMIVDHEVYRYCDAIGTHVYGSQIDDWRLDRPWKHLAAKGVRRPVVCSEAGVTTGWTPKGLDGRQWQADFFASWFVKLRRMGYSRGLLFTHDEDHTAAWAVMRVKGEKVPLNWEMLAEISKPRQLLNGGFEQANNKRYEWGPDRNVDSRDGWPDALWTWQDATNPHGGKFCARANQGAGQDRFAAYHVVDGVTPGKPVKVVGFIRVSAGKARLGVYGYDKCDGDAATLSEPIAGDQWQRVAVTVAPSNPWVVIGLTVESTGKQGDFAWFDDIAISQ